MKNKSTFNILIYIAVVFALIFLPNELKAREKSKDSTYNNLKDKIEYLEKKIENQQDEIEGLRNDIYKMKKIRPRLAIPENEGDKNFRRGRRFEFNGQIYYKIPLNSNKFQIHSDK